MKTLLISAVLAVTACAAQAGIITVDNRAESPAQYTTIKEAVAAALVGDTLLVASSPTDYGWVNVNKQLVIIGEGYYDLNTEPTKINITLEQANAAVNASGTTIMGIWGTINLTDNVTRITIERSRITVSMYSSYDAVVNITNCIIHDIQYMRGGNKLAFKNNIIIGNVSRYEENLPNVLFSHNIFLGQSKVLFEGFKSLIFENNIFYGVQPNKCISCTFTNNATYMNADNALPGTNNLGSGNFPNVNPKFTIFPLSASTFAYEFDYHLMADSPLKGKGTDGSDLGIYGGNFPYLVGGGPAIPVVTAIEMASSSVPQGGTLKINFTAKVQK